MKQLLAQRFSIFDYEDCLSCLADSTAFVCQDSLQQSISYCCTQEDLDADQTYTQNSCQTSLLCSNPAVDPSLQQLACPYIQPQCPYNNTYMILNLGDITTVRSKSNFQTSSFCSWQIQSEDAAADQTIPDNSYIFLFISFIQNTTIQIYQGNTITNANLLVSLDDSDTLKQMYDPQYSLFMIVQPSDINPLFNFTIAYQRVDPNDSSFDPFAFIALINQNYSSSDSDSNQITDNNSSIGNNTNNMNDTFSQNQTSNTSNVPANNMTNNSNWNNSDTINQSSNSNTSQSINSSENLSNSTNDNKTNTSSNNSTITNSTNSSINVSSSSSSALPQQNNSNSTTVTNPCNGANYYQCNNQSTSSSSSQISSSSSSSGIQTSSSSSVPNSVVIIGPTSSSSSLFIGKTCLNGSTNCTNDTSYNQTNGNETSITPVVTSSSQPSIAIFSLLVCIIVGIGIFVLVDEIDNYKNKKKHKQIKILNEKEDNKELYEELEDPIKILYGQDDSIDFQSHNERNLIKQQTASDKINDLEQEQLVYAIPKNESVERRHTYQEEEKDDQLSDEYQNKHQHSQKRKRSVSRVQSSKSFKEINQFEERITEEYKAEKMSYQGTVLTGRKSIQNKQVSVSNKHEYQPQSIHQNPNFYNQSKISSTYIATEQNRPNQLSNDSHQSQSDADLINPKTKIKTKKSQKIVQGKGPKSVKVNQRNKTQLITKEELYQEEEEHNIVSDTIQNRNQTLKQEIQNQRKQNQIHTNKQRFQHRKEQVIEDSSDILSKNSMSDSVSGSQGKEILFQRQFNPMSNDMQMQNYDMNQYTERKSSRKIFTPAKEKLRLEDNY